MPTDCNATGVSIVLCCYNSRSRLGPTLAHLAAQIIPSNLGFEVVLVDNASTDDTADFARSCWQVNHPYSLRIVTESEPGLSAARMRGLAEACYPYVSFVDDDNWVCCDWIRIVHETFTSHPEIAAVGGWAIAEYETPPPEWYAPYVARLAIGPQGTTGEDVTENRGWLYGAGLSLRKCVWEQLLADGFQFCASDRKGSSLSSGGDVELCYALRLAGWRLRYEPSLQLTHAISVDRLTWDYFRRLMYQSSEAYPIYEAYKMSLYPASSFRSRLRFYFKSRWIPSSLSAIWRLCFRPYGVYLCVVRPSPQHAGIIAPVLQECGRIAGFWNLRTKYHRTAIAIRNSKWNRLSGAIGGQTS